MKKIKYSGLLLLLAVAFQSSFASVSPIKKDFAKFDSHFIATLFLTAQGKQEKAASEMNLLLNYWKTFKSEYYSYESKDSKWKSDFDKVESILKSAEQIIKGGKKIHDAHEKLEKIREIFYALRQRNSIDYYLDGLIKFHGNMEKIVHPLKGKKPKDVNKKLISALSKAVNKAEKDWRAFAEQKFDNETYSFPPAKIQKLQKAIKVEGRTLKKLKDALKKSDKQKIVKLGMSVKKNFRNVFLLFSDLR